MMPSAPGLLSSIRRAGRFFVPSEQDVTTTLQRRAREKLNRTQKEKRRRKGEKDELAMFNAMATSTVNANARRSGTTERGTTRHRLTAFRNFNRVIMI